MTRSLALLLAGGAGIGMFAAAGGSAFAALQNSDGSGIPVQVQGGSVGLPAQTNSIKITVPGTGSSCVAVTSSGSNVNTGGRVTEGTQFELDAYNDGACQGTNVGSIGYTASYNGAAPTNGTYSRVLVRIASAKMFVCSDSGWTDGNSGVCRDA